MTINDNRENVDQKRWRLLLVVKRNSGVVTAYVIALCLLIITGIVTPEFISGNGVKGFFNAVTFVGICAVGQTFVVLGGGLDLSLPWVITAGGVGLAIVTNTTMHGNIGNGIIVVILFGILIGIVNGCGVVLLNMSPLIVTLATGSVVEGIVLFYSGGGSGGAAPNLLTKIGENALFTIPDEGILWLLIVVVASFVLLSTPFGRRVYAIGQSKRVALFSGVPIRLTIIGTYVLSSVLAVVTGIVLLGYVGNSYLSMGQPFLFASFAAVALGGGSLIGGKGNAMGTAGGTLILGGLTMLLGSLILSPGTSDIVYGGIIIVAVTISRIRPGRRIV